MANNTSYRDIYVDKGASFSHVVEISVPFLEYTFAGAIRKSYTAAYAVPFEFEAVEDYPNKLRIIINSENTTLIEGGRFNRAIYDIFATNIDTGLVHKEREGSVFLSSSATEGELPLPPPDYQIDIGDINGFGTGVENFLSIPTLNNLNNVISDANVVSIAGTETLTNKTFVAPVLGTPLSGVLTNCTGTAAGLTAGNVTTNANLTGPVTSVGNATSIANATITNAMLANGAVANLSGANTGDQINTSTPTTITGFLKGNGSTVAVGAIVSADITDATRDGAANPGKVLKTDAFGYVSVRGVQVNTASGGAVEFITGDPDAPTLSSSLYPLGITNSPTWNLKDASGTIAFTSDIPDGSAYATSAQGTLATNAVAGTGGTATNLTLAGTLAVGVLDTSAGSSKLNLRNAAGLGTGDAVQFGAVTGTTGTFSDNVTSSVTGKGLAMHGGGTVTGASGAVTVAASGTNQDITLTPSGTGQTFATGNLFARESNPVIGAIRTDGSKYSYMSTSNINLGVWVDLRAQSDGVLLIANNSVTDLNRLQLGGTTDAYPAIKRNSTAINIRLADDSADAPLTCSNLTASATVTMPTIAISGADAPAIAANKALVRTELGLGTGDSPTFAGASLGAGAVLNLATGLTINSAAGNFQTIQFTSNGGSLRGTDNGQITVGCVSGTLYLGNPSNPPVGLFYAGNYTGFAASHKIGWSSTGAPSGTIDAGFARASDGVLEINNGTSGTLRDLSLRNLTASGDVEAGGSDPATRTIINGRTALFTNGYNATCGVKFAEVTNYSPFFAVGSGSMYAFSEGVAINGSAITLALSRVSANVIGLGNGTPGDFSKDLKLTNLTASATVTVGSNSWNGSTISGAQAFSSTTRPTSAGTGTPAATSLITQTDLESGTATLTNKTLTNPTINNFTEGVVSTSVGASHTIVLTNGTRQRARLTASIACAFTLPTATDGKSFMLEVEQAAATGNGTATFGVSGPAVDWGTAGAPTITATAGKMDILTFMANGTKWYGSYRQGYTY